MEFHSNTSPLKLIVARTVVGELDNKTRLLEAEGRININIFFELKFFYK